MVPVPCMFPLSTLEIDVFCCYLLRYVCGLTLAYVCCSLEFLCFASSRQSSRHFKKRGLGHFCCFLRCMARSQSFWLIFLSGWMKDTNVRDSLSDQFPRHWGASATADVKLKVSCKNTWLVFFSGFDCKFQVRDSPRLWCLSTILVYRI